MKVFCISIMIVGFFFVLFAVDSASGSLGFVWGIFGSSLFGSGVISLAITQALEKKP